MFSRSLTCIYFTIIEVNTLQQGLKLHHLKMHETCIPYMNGFFFWTQKPLNLKLLLCLQINFRYLRDEMKGIIFECHGIFLYFICLLSTSVRPKLGFGIGNRNQGPITVSVSEPKLFVTKLFFSKFFNCYYVFLLLGVI